MQLTTLCQTVYETTYSIIMTRLLNKNRRKCTQKTKLELRFDEYEKQRETNR